jgi:hypothetical protein
MKTIPFTEKEISHIKEVYSEELGRLQKRAAEVSSLLSKLSGEEGDESTKKAEKAVEKVAEKVAKKIAKVEAVAALDAKPKAKRGRPALVKAPKVEEVKLISEEVNAEVVKGKRGRPAGVKLAKAEKAEKPAKVAKEKPVKEAKVKAVAPVVVAPEKPVKEKKIKAVTAVKVAKEKPLKEKKVKAVTAVKVAKEKPAKGKKVKVETAEKGQRGRKKSPDSKRSQWTGSILEVLGKKSQLLTSREIVESVMKIQNIPDLEYTKTRSIIAGSLSDLKLETKRIRSINNPKGKGELYGLTEWFNAGGELLDATKNVLA